MREICHKQKKEFPIFKGADPGIAEGEAGLIGESAARLVFQFDTCLTNYYAIFKQAEGTVGMKCPKCHFENPDDTVFCGKCASPLRPSEKASVTKTLITPAKRVERDSTVAGKYRILEKLGEGGMGMVYRAQDLRLDRTVALKFLPPELTRDPEARKRFIQEAKTASALDHNNICTIHEIDEGEDEQVFIAMACYEGESLKDKIKRGPLEEREVLDIALQVGGGLEKAHKKSIIHRDIKPANIMVTSEGVAKILDFGLAKIKGEARLTRTGTTVGTVAYMSPEQAQGEGIDQRTDIWSLGVVLYEMLTGQLPFEGKQEGSLVYAIVHRSPRPMRKLEPQVRPELERVVGKALEKKPSDRYQSMGEFLEDLKAIAEGLKPLRAKVSLFRGRVLGIRKPLFLAISTLVMVLAALGLLAFLSGPGRAEVFDSVAILPIINETGDAEREYFANGLTRELNTELYKVAALTVPPAETILTYKNSDKPPKKIAQELGVKALVQVSWLQAGNRHRLNYELSDPFRNKVIAADRLEMEEENIIILQRELARAVVAAVKVAVTSSEQALLAGGQKVDPEAYDLYLRGYNSYKISYNRDEALKYFDRAINADPNLALAHVYKGNVYWDLGINGKMPEKDAYPKARESIEKALELDNNLAIALSNMGWILCIMDWDFAGAESRMKRALDLEPGNCDIQENYGIFLRIMGRHEESIETFTKLQKSLPSGHTDLLASAYLWAGRLDEGVDIAEKVYQKNPSALNKYWLAFAYTLKGNYNEALSLYNDLSALVEYSEQVLIDFATVYALSGKREEALETLKRAEMLWAEKNIDRSFESACVYAALGEKDKAIDLLNQVYEKHSGVLVNLRTFPILRSLHDDPRFQDLVKKVGFPEVQLPAKEK